MEPFRGLPRSLFHSDGVSSRTVFPSITTARRLAAILACASAARRLARSASAGPVGLFDDERRRVRHRAQRDEEPLPRAQSAPTSSLIGRRSHDLPGASTRAGLQQLDRISGCTVRTIIFSVGTGSSGPSADPRTLAKSAERFEHDLVNLDEVRLVRAAASWPTRAIARAALADRRAESPGVEEVAAEAERFRRRRHRRGETRDAAAGALDGRS